jgi:hypothetical protein
MSEENALYGDPGANKAISEDTQDSVLRTIWIIGRLKVLDELRDRRWAKQREKDLFLLAQIEKRRA